MTLNPIFLDAGGSLEGGADFWSQRLLTEDKDILTCAQSSRRIKMFVLFVILLQGKNCFLSASLNFIYRDSLDLIRLLPAFTKLPQVVLFELNIFKWLDPTVNLVTWQTLLLSGRKRRDRLWGGKNKFPLEVVVVVFFFFYNFVTSQDKRDVYFLARGSILGSSLVSVSERSEKHLNSAVEKRQGALSSGGSSE